MELPKDPMMLFSFINTKFAWLLFFIGWTLWWYECQ